MPIEEVKSEETQSEPLLQIKLPSPQNGNPKEPLTYGVHNAAAQHNFQQVADLLLKLIQNQKNMSQVLVSQGNAIKTQQEAMQSVSNAIGDFIKKEDEKEND